jgi:hypothetical protein
MCHGVITKFKINNDLTSDFIVGELGLYANDTNDVNIISRAITLRGKLQAKQDEFSNNAIIDFRASTHHREF